MIAVVEGPSPDHDRPRRHQLGEHLPAQTRRVEMRESGNRLAKPFV
jgi:hypothetical protein